MRIEVDRDVCVGAGNCAWTVPEVFDQGDDGLVVLRQAQPLADLEPADLERRVRHAVDRCPSGAVRIVAG